MCICLRWVKDLTFGLLAVHSDDHGAAPDDRLRVQGPCCAAQLSMHTCVVGWCMCICVCVSRCVRGLPCTRSGPPVWAVPNPNCPPPSWLAHPTGHPKTADRQTDRQREKRLRDNVVSPSAAPTCVSTASLPHVSRRFMAWRHTHTYHPSSQPHPQPFSLPHSPHRAVWRVPYSRAV